MACQSFTHGELILVLTRSWTHKVISLAHGKLLPAGWQVSRAIFKEKIGAAWGDVGSINGAIVVHVV